VGFFDRDGRYVRVNDALAELNGVPSDAHIGRTVEEVLPEIAPSVRGHIEQALAGGEPVAVTEVARPQPDGT
ncbi:PAS domain-containing protein, partial [Escherichia coli]